jgi:trans-aconitate 2-methyltransferase
VVKQEVAAAGPWAARLRSAALDPLASVSAYYEALLPHARRVDLCHTVYNH